MIDYYNARAHDYEEIYHRDNPDQQRELSLIADELRRLFRNRRVLEIACGTGYWTAAVAHDVESIVATDFADDALEIARTKNLPGDRVRFLKSDACTLGGVSGQFDGGFANFWLSHVPHDRISGFLANFHAKLVPGARIFFADNMYVEGLGGVLEVKEGESDTYKRRRLKDGREYLVLKNYYCEGQLKKLFQPFTDDMVVNAGDYYWIVSYEIR